MIVLVATYHVKPGQGDAVAAALRKMAPLVQAGEPGCTLYHANRSTETLTFSCFMSIMKIRPRS